MSLSDDIAERVLKRPALTAESTVPGAAMPLAERNTVRDSPNKRVTKALNLADLRDKRFERTEWFEANMIPRAELTLANGDGGIGKTTVLLDLVARSSAGMAMPSGLRHDPPLRWLIVAEEDRHGLLRVRLDAAGADHDNIRLVESVGEERDFLSFPTHAAALQNAIAEGPFDGVLIDALLNHLDDDVNASKPQEMRRAIRPLTDIAHETGAIIVAIRHLSKGSGPASSRGLGSVEARNLCRSELAIAPHPDEDAHEGLFVIALSKANLSPDRSATMAYRLTSIDVTDDAGMPTTIARVDWTASPPISADDLLNPPDARDRGKLEAASDWLRDALASGERRASEVITDAEDAGFKKDTLYRAKRVVGVGSKRSGFPAQSYWFRKTALVSQVSDIESSAKTGTFAKTGALFDGHSAAASIPSEPANSSPAEPDADAIADFFSLWGGDEAASPEARV